MSLQMMDVLHGDGRAEVTSVDYYSCAVFERGEHSLADFLKTNRRLHHMQKVSIFHQLLQAVFFMHNEKGASSGVVCYLICSHIVSFLCFSYHSEELVTRV